MKIFVYNYSLLAAFGGLGEPQVVSLEEISSSRKQQTKQKITKSNYIHITKLKKSGEDKSENGDDDDEDFVIPGYEPDPVPTTSEQKNIKTLDHNGNLFFTLYIVEYSLSYM